MSERACREALAQVKADHLNKRIQLPLETHAMVENALVEPPARLFRYRQANDRKTYEGWFVALVDEGTGCLAVLSDYGDHTHRWNLRGMPEGVSFRRFLTQCDPDYIRRKLSPREEYDGEGTRDAIREDICRVRREGRLSKEEARDEWDQATNVLDHECAFGEWLNGGPRLSDAFELRHTRVPPQVVAFMERVWPRVVADIKKDLVGEP